MTRSEESVTIEAEPERVYELVSDVTRMGEWSPECRRCEWLDGATGPAVGSAFRGDNRIGPYRWSTTAKVTAAEPGREFAFTVVAHGRETTAWRYHLEPTGKGTAVTESYELLWTPPLPVLWLDTLVGRGKMLRRGMRKTLDRLKAAAEEG